MAHTGYNLVDPSDLSKSTVVRASDAMYYGDFSDAAELRPLRVQLRAASKVLSAQSSTIFRGR